MRAPNRVDFRLDPETRARVESFTQESGLDNFSAGLRALLILGLDSNSDAPDYDAAWRRAVQQENMKRIHAVLADKMSHAISDALAEISK